MRTLILLLLLLPLFSIAQPVCCVPDSLLFDSCRQDRIFRIADSLDQLNKQVAVEEAINKIKKNDDSLNSLSIVHELLDIGQSNMGGQGDSSRFHFSPLNTCPDDLHREFTRVFMQQADGSIKPLKLGSTNFAIGNGSCGPEIGQAYNFELLNKNQNEKLLIKKRVIYGGTLSSFMQGTAFYDSMWRLHDSLAVEWYKENRCKVVSIDVNFSQGEGDKNSTKSAHYTKLVNFRNQLLQSNKIYDNSKFIVSRISTSSALFGLGVDSAFDMLAAAYPTVSIIDNNGRALQSDNVHYMPESYFDIGMEFIVRTYGGKTKNIATMSSSTNPLVTIDGTVNISSVSLAQLNAANAHSDSLFHILDSTSKKIYKREDSIKECSGVLYFTRSGGVNVWHVKERHNIKDSCVISGNYVDIYFGESGHINNSLGATISNGIVTNNIGLTTGSYALALNGFAPGARMLDDNRIRVSLAQIMELQVTITYDSASDTWSKYQPDPKPSGVNLSSSYAPVITYGNDATTGVLWLQISVQGLFLPVELLDVKASCSDVSDKAYQFTLSPVYSDLSRVKVQYADGTDVTSIKPRDKTKLTLKYGAAQGLVNPTTAIIGNNGEFTIKGAYKDMNLQK